MDAPTGREVSSSEPARAIEAKILDLLAARGPGKTICPSEVARALHSGPRPGAGRDDEHAAGWRALMDPVRAAAARLVASGEIVATQGGEIIDLSTASGPIRLARRHERHVAE